MRYVDTQVALSVRIRAYRRPRLLLAVGAMAACLTVIVLEVRQVLLGGRPDLQLLCLVIPLMGLAGYELSNRQVIRCNGTARILGKRLTISLPGTRLAGKRYVDQVYEMRVGDILDARILYPQVWIRARVLESIAIDGGIKLSHEAFELGELSFEADREGCTALREMILQAMKS